MTPEQRAAAINAAIEPVMLIGLQDAELLDEPGRERIRKWAEWISETIAALPLYQQAPNDAAQQQNDTLPAWLHRRFGTRGQYGQTWATLSDDDRAYWEHEAAAVRRAVTRNGFKTPTRPSSAPEASN